MPGFEAVSYHGIFAPAKTPEAIVAQTGRRTLSAFDRAGVRIEQMRDIAGHFAAGSIRAVRRG